VERICISQKIMKFAVLSIVNSACSVMHKKLLDSIMLMMIIMVC